jgi:hypothetical protein
MTARREQLTGVTGEPRHGVTLGEAHVSAKTEAATRYGHETHTAGPVRHRIRPANTVNRGTPAFRP